MYEFAYTVQGYLTVRTNFLRAPLSGSLAVREDPHSGDFTGNLVLDESTISQTLLGVSIFGATVQITADSLVTGHVDREGRTFATVTVEAVIGDVRAYGRTLISGGSYRTARHAIVPLRSVQGFDLERGGRMVGSYQRPPFTGGGLITPVFNLFVAGPGNSVVIDLIPRKTAGAAAAAAVPARTLPRPAE